MPTKSTEFYRVERDHEIDGRQLYTFPMVTDGRLQALNLVRAKDVAYTHVDVTVAKPGKVLDFDFAVDAKVPILSTKAAAVFERIARADVQLFPARVNGVAGLRVLNIRKMVDCVNWARSTALYHKKTGKPSVLIDAVLNEELAGPEVIFRVLSTFVVVRKSLKDALMEAGMTGAAFTPLETVTDVTN